jgi:hypothetical protein
MTNNSKKEMKLDAEVTKLFSSKTTELSCNKLACFSKSMMVVLIAEHMCFRNPVNDTTKCFTTLAKQWPM